jgi:hypothetical protein
LGLSFAPPVLVISSVTHQATTALVDPRSFNLTSSPPPPHVQHYAGLVVPEDVRSTIYRSCSILAFYLGEAFPICFPLQVSSFSILHNNKFSSCPRVLRFSSHWLLLALRHSMYDGIVSNVFERSVVTGHNRGAAHSMVHHGTRQSSTDTDGPHPDDAPHPLLEIMKPVYKNGKPHGRG